MKTIEINGATFEVTRPRKNKPDFNKAMCYDGRGLYNYYERPSHIKELIWAEWRNWANDVDGIITFGISGANDFQFTITATYIDDFGQRWVLDITSAHNRAILAE